MVKPLGGGLTALRGRAKAYVLFFAASSDSRQGLATVCGLGSGARAKSQTEIPIGARQNGWRAEAPWGVCVLMLWARKTNSVSRRAVSGRDAGWVVERCEAKTEEPWRNRKQTNAALLS